MERLRVFFSWNCSPLWLENKEEKIYDEVFVDEVVRDIPELGKYPELFKRLFEAQKIYDDLFIDTPKVFEYKGFDDPKEEEVFYQEVYSVVQEIKEKLKEGYTVSDEIDYPIYLMEKHGWVNDFWG